MSSNRVAVEQESPASKCRVGEGAKPESRKGRHVTDG